MYLFVLRCVMPPHSFSHIYHSEINYYGSNLMIYLYIWRQRKSETNYCSPRCVSHFFYPQTLSVSNFSNKSLFQSSLLLELLIEYQNQHNVRIIHNSSGWLSTEIWIQFTQVISEGQPQPRRSSTGFHRNLKNDHIFRKNSFYCSYGTILSS